MACFEEYDVNWAHRCAQCFKFNEVLALWAVKDEGDVAVCLLISNRQAYTGEKFKIVSDTYATEVFPEYVHVSVVHRIEPFAHDGVKPLGENGLHNRLVEHGKREPHVGQRTVGNVYFLAGQGAALACHGVVGLAYFCKSFFVFGYYILVHDFRLLYSRWFMRCGLR